MAHLKKQLIEKEDDNFVCNLQLPLDYMSKATPPGSKSVSRAISSENVLLKPAFINSNPRRSGTFNQSN